MHQYWIEHKRMNDYGKYWMKIIDVCRGWVGGFCSSPVHEMRREQFRETRCWKSLLIARAFVSSFIAIFFLRALIWRIFSTLLCFVWNFSSIFSFFALEMFSRVLHSTIALINGTATTELNLNYSRNERLSNDFQIQEKFHFMHTFPARFNSITRGL